MSQNHFSSQWQQKRARIESKSSSQPKTKLSNFLSFNLRKISSKKIEEKITQF